MKEINRKICKFIKKFKDMFYVVRISCIEKLTNFKRAYKKLDYSPITNWFWGGSFMDRGMRFRALLTSNTKHLMLTSCFKFFFFM